jgi:hypothetical protein
MYVRVPVGQRAVGLDAGHYPHGQIIVARESAHGGGYGPGGHAGEVAEQLAAVQAPKSAVR